MDEEISNEEIGKRVKGLLEIFKIARNDLAEEMGVSYNTLTKKLNGKADFTFQDFMVIKRVFNLKYESCGEIFFNSEFLIKKQGTEKAAEHENENK